MDGGEDSFAWLREAVEAVILLWARAVTRADEAHAARRWAERDEADARQDVTALSRLARDGVTIDVEATWRRALARLHDARTRQVDADDAAHAAWRDAHALWALARTLNRHLYRMQGEPTRRHPITIARGDAAEE